MIELQVEVSIEFKLRGSVICRAITIQAPRKNSATGAILFLFFILFIYFCGQWWCKLFLTMHLEAVNGWINITQFINKLNVWSVWFHRQTRYISLLETRNYFCWRRTTSVYVISDHKLTAGVHGSSQRCWQNDRNHLSWELKWSVGWKCISFSSFHTTCRRHQMDAFSALLAIWAENSPVTGEFPAQRPVLRSFDVFFDLRLNKRLSKQSWGWWFETLSRLL